jgi:hypothetical protein
MTVTAVQLQRLQSMIEDVLGEEHATLLMQLLTGHDYGVPADELPARIALLEARLDALEQDWGLVRC